MQTNRRGQVVLLRVAIGQQVYAQWNTSRERVVHGHAHTHAWTHGHAGMRTYTHTLAHTHRLQLHTDTQVLMGSMNQWVWRSEQGGVAI